VPAAPAERSAILRRDRRNRGRNAANQGHCNVTSPLLPREFSAPVIIVGGGPVGMMLALNLSTFDVRSIIVNTDPAPRWHPKGSTHNARTMEHYRRHGLSKAIRTFGLPSDYPTDVGYFTRWTKWEIARLAMASERQKMEAVRNAAATDQIPEPLLRCNQMYVEAHVFRHLQTLPTVELRFGWRCNDWSESADGVSIEIEEVATGRHQTLRCQYLIGCDGGQSSIRRKLGIRYSGEKPEEQPYMGGTMVSTYVRAPELLSVIPHKSCWQYWTVNAALRSNIVSLNGKDEFIFLTQLAANEQKPDDARIRRRLLDSLGREIDLHFIGHWTWTAGQALVAERFGRGRVLLAGDAVHLFTPAGGFGMNTGIDDAANLGWKLAGAVQGWGGPKLIESYEIERRPIAFRNTGLARSLNRSIGAVPVDAAIEESSPAGDEARRKTGEFLAGFGEEYASLGIQLGARYASSPLVADDGTAPPADDPYRYTPTACPGGRAPHVWIGREVSLFDKLGSGFTLLRLNGRAPETRALEAAAAVCGIPLKTLDVDVAEARDLYERDLALIRPDQHVAWRGNELPEDCSALIRRVVGG
jgi:2-polyprenyl-6-methoxyphenol hydroxylase-like FAD-dependent oxidoreductase